MLGLRYLVMFTPENIVAVKKDTQSFFTAPLPTSPLSRQSTTVYSTAFAISSPTVENKKTIRLDGFFVWLPLLGSNQRHHD